MSVWRILLFQLLTSTPEVLVLFQGRAECKNAAPETFCTRWATQTSCRNHLAFQLVCRKTCNSCDVPCVDVDCGWLKKIPGLCNMAKNILDFKRHFYRGLCARSCGLCSPAETTEECSESHSVPCGKPNPYRPRVRIVGGSEAGLNEYPWMAGIRFKGALKFWCGGALVSDRFVLTAAHCIEKKEAIQRYEIVLGVYDYTHPNMSTKLSLGVKRLLLHPEYVYAPRVYDYCLIELDQAIDFQRYTHLSTICLPAGPTPTDQMVTTAGWGAKEFSSLNRSPKLLKVELKVFSKEACEAIYHRDSPSFLCAGSDEGGKDSCQGDSGGPLMQNINSTFEIAGVVSFGENCGLPGVPSVYANVFAVKEWITSTIISKDCVKKKNVPSEMRPRMMMEIPEAFVLTVDE